MPIFQTKEFSKKVAILEECFKEADSNGDGNITLAEMKDFMDQKCIQQGQAQGFSREIL